MECGPPRGTNNFSRGRGRARGEYAKNPYFSIKRKESKNDLCNSGEQNESN